MNHDDEDLIAFLGFTPDPSDLQPVTDAAAPSGPPERLFDWQPEWVSFRSSDVEAMAYWPDGRGLGVLLVRFHSGNECHYTQVPALLWRRFLSTPSAGEAFWALIRRAGYPAIYARRAPKGGRRRKR